MKTWLWNVTGTWIHDKKTQQDMSESSLHMDGGELQVISHLENTLFIMDSS